jgi:hypothetical protein
MYVIVLSDGETFDALEASVLLSVPDEVANREDVSDELSEWVKNNAHRGVPLTTLLAEYLWKSST